VGRVRRVRLTQLDGKLPNLALMKLAHYHRDQGDEVYLERNALPTMFEEIPDIAYASVIFSGAVEPDSAAAAAQFKRSFPTGFISGTGIDPKTGGITVEEMLGLDSGEPWPYEQYDYSIYPEFKASIGFSQRGCRLNCDFCGVRGKEGKAHSVNAIAKIWRGGKWPKKLHLLDNDFFGVPEWRDRIAEIRDGGFRVCLSQGINIRLINEEQARELATIEYRDTDFSERRLYTAWDNVGHERIFFNGVDMLERCGIPSKHLMVYMLVNHAAGETWERRWYRFGKMVDRDIRPFIMVFNKSTAPADIVCWQRWVNAGLYRIIPWDEYRRETKSQASVDGWRSAGLEVARG
jgi:hypothetical protein